MDFILLQSMGLAGNILLSLCELCTERRLYLLPVLGSLVDTGI